MAKKEIDKRKDGSMKAKFIIPKGYRILRRNERIKEGDRKLFVYCKKLIWKKITMVVGYLMSECDDIIIRRVATASQAK